MKKLPPAMRAFQTPNTKQAAALLTANVPFFSSSVGDDIVANVYTEDRPYKDGRPGHIFYFLSPTSLDGFDAEELTAAFFDDEFTPVKELDALVEEVGQVDPTLGEKLRKAIPRATVSISRCALENRERIIDLWRNAKPMILVKRGEKSLSLVSRDSTKAREKWGL
jgi:hypothetical protein